MHLSPGMPPGAAYPCCGLVGDSPPLTTTFHLRGRHALVDVTVLDEQEMHAHLAVGKRRLCDLPCELDPVDLGDLVENRDGCPVPQEDTLRVNGYGICHDARHPADEERAITENP